MVAINPPVITLKGGGAIENIEEILRKYNFKKNEDVLRPEYYLFKEKDPILVSVASFFDASFNKCTGIAIVSYDERINQVIMCELERELGAELYELETEEQIQTFTPLRKFYEKRFFDFVLGKKD